MINTVLLLALTSELPVDKAAHFGVSWAVNHTAYTVCNKLTDDKTQLECLIGSAVGTLVVGATKELIDGNRNSRTQHAKDMLANTAGVALSSLMITLSW